VIAAATATVPWWLASICDPWHFPWYYLFSILAGELLLVFLAGFLFSFLEMPFTITETTLCKKCRAPMFLVGRHFDPLGSRRPHWRDIAIFVLFVGLNITVWFEFASIMT
jgi:hypothetical protein